MGVARSSTVEAPGRRGTRWLGGLFLLLFGLYVLTASGHIHTVDSYQVYNVTKSLAERGELDIPRSYMAVQGTDGRYYSKLGVGQSLLAWPLFELAHALYAHAPTALPAGLERAQSSVRLRLDGSEARPAHLRGWPRTREDPFCSALVVLWFNPLVTAVGMTLMALLLMEMGYAPRSVAITVLATAFGTYVWAQSRDFFQHPLEMALLTATLLLWVRARGRPGPASAVAMGVVGGLALLTRIFSITWVPLWLLALCSDLRRSRAGWQRSLTVLSCYLGPVLAASSILLWLNRLRFGFVSHSGYHTAYDQRGFSTPLLEGLWVNLFSPARSLFLHAPPLVLALLVVPAFFVSQRRVALLVAGFALVYLVGYSKWWAYDGGWCIGPRYLLPLVPLLMLPVAGLLDRPASGRRRHLALAAVILLAACGAALQIVWISPEYTAIYTMTRGRMYSVLDAARALLQGGRPGLDYFYLNLWDQVPGAWYALLVALPGVSILGGLWLLSGAGAGRRSAP